MVSFSFLCFNYCCTGAHFLKLQLYLNIWMQYLWTLFPVGLLKFGAGCSRTIQSYPSGLLHWDWSENAECQLIIPIKNQTWMSVDTPNANKGKESRINIACYAVHIGEPFDFFD